VGRRKEIQSHGKSINFFTTVSRFASLSFTLVTSTSYAYYFLTWSL
jgi:hypothetical protein